MFKKLVAELLGTAWLVFGGCGSAVIAAGFPEVGIGLLGVSFAFGLTVLTGAYAFGGISGGHFNPAVTLGLVAARRFPASQAVAYIISQVAGALLGAAALYLIATGKAGFDVSAGFASNGYDAHSPGGYSFVAAFSAEVILTAIFLLVITCVTASSRLATVAPLAIGLCLTLIHLISIPVTNTSVNPARSTGVALFAGGWAVEQLWLFWVAPIVGGIIGGVIGAWLSSEESSS